MTTPVSMPFGSMVVVVVVVGGCALRVACV
jgi:hypothetical protein